MNNSPNTEASRRGRRVKAIIAGVAGVALLLGGTTFANWSAGFNQSLGTITNGDLDVAVGAGGVKYYSWKAGNDNAFGKSNITLIPDISQFKAVPSDTIEMQIPVDVTLVGTNMQAQFKLATTSGTIDLASKGYSLAYSVYKLNDEGNTVSSTVAESQSFGADTIGTAGTLLSKANLTTSGKYVLSLRASLSAQNREKVNVALDLSAIKVSLEQQTVS
ncbi:MAG: alternate-type signal peptide domain-containing protein [Propionibacteriaceae bacterium]|jgi:alternate signal-mediated exported protein|nr:alternate-type signal peptide domain-containing protein [Propionibacteriaceae bacterium]